MIDIIKACNLKDKAMIM